MRVAYVCCDAGVPAFGAKGCSIHLQEIVRAFLERGDTVDLFVARTGGDAPPDLKGCRAHTFDSPVCETVRERELAQFHLATAIAEAIHPTRFDLVYERYSLWSNAVMEKCSRLDKRNRGSRCATVLEVNAPLIEEQKAHRQLVDESLARRVAQSAFRGAETVICVSAEVAQYVRRELSVPGPAENAQHNYSIGQETATVMAPPVYSAKKCDRSENRVHVVPNGVNLKRFSARATPSYRDAAFTVGFVGSLKPWHGLEDLFEAFVLLSRLVENARLRIVGDGPLRSKLEAQIAEQASYLTSNIDWVGMVAPHEVAEHLAAVDVAVAPYPQTGQFYFSPLKVYEYLASGRAVVVSEVGQLASLVQDGRNGRIFQPGNVRELATVLAQLAFDPPMRQRLGAQARQDMLASHSWTATLERILRHVEDFQRGSERD